MSESSFIEVFQISYDVIDPLMILILFYMEVVDILHQVVPRHQEVIINDRKRWCIGIIHNDVGMLLPDHRYNDSEFHIVRIWPSLQEAGDCCCKIVLSGDEIALDFFEDIDLTPNAETVVETLSAGGAFEGVTRHGVLSARLDTVRPCVSFRIKVSNTVVLIGSVMLVSEYRIEKLRFR